MKRSKIALSAQSIVLALASVLVLAFAGAGTASAASTPIVVAALGDSFTAGPGTGFNAEDTSVYAAGTGSSGNECYRASSGYPQLAVNSLNAQHNGNTYQLVNLSCAGVTTDGVLSATTRQTADGRTVTIPAQIDSLPSNADRVVLTIGGNDVGFADFVTCILGNIYSATPDCTEASSAIVTTRAAITTVQAKISNVLQAIKAKAPNAKIVIAGYPQIAPTTGAYGAALGCQPWLTAGEMTIANSIEQALNAEIAAAAAANGATYVNQYQASPYTTTACTVALNRQINGIIAFAQYASFHPNNQGAYASKALVVPALQ